MKMSSGDLRIVTTKTPLRITFTGGGTDLPQYYRSYGPGAVVSAAIDRYIYISVSRNFRKDEIRVSYSKTENGLMIRIPQERKSFQCPENFLLLNLLPDNF